MTRAKLYTVIYVVLFVLATGQVLIERAGIDYWTAFAAILVVSFVKAVVVAGYYQHLRWEPRSLSTLMVLGLLTALTLTIAAGFSILT